MTKAQFGTAEYYRAQLLDIEDELANSLDKTTGRRSYAYAYGRLSCSMKSCIAHLESATASQACRPGCKYIQGHSGPCIERDLDAEVNAGKWGPPGSGLAEFVERCNWGPPRNTMAHLVGLFKDEPDEDLVNVNHE